RLGETEYGIKWILLGGYIRMIGMYSPDRSPRAAKTGWRAKLADAAREATRDDLAEHAAKLADGGIGPATAPGAMCGGAGTAGAASGNFEGVADRAFYRLSAPRKLVVMLGGPTMNLILALVFLAVALSGVGAYNYSNAIGGVTECVTADGAAADCGGGGAVETPAQAAGLRAGDRIVGWDGKPVRDWDELLRRVGQARPEPVAVTVERAGERINLEVTPLEVAAGTADARVVIGVTAGDLELIKQPLSRVPEVLWQQVATSAKLYAGLPVAVWETLVDLIEGNERSPDSPVSIVGIARISGEVAAVDTEGTAIDGNRLRWGTWLQLGAAVNLALWMFNLLPLLPLDGGHVANTLFEGGRRTIARWRGRPPPGPADSARLMPLTYVVVGLLILMTVILVVADVTAWYP
ncbi:MAG: RIP metalloprotease, partial [Bifidobacteriaceae bacterium]|nr:RIP metalloprotease [Bifidobacteriaceae bacterium]